MKILRMVLSFIAIVIPVFFGCFFLGATGMGKRDLKWKRR